MNELPNLELEVNTEIYSTPDNGKLIYDYRPFYNRKLSYFDGKSDLDSLTLNAEKGRNSYRPTYWIKHRRILWWLGKFNY